MVHGRRGASVTSLTQLILSAMMEGRKSASYRRIQWMLQQCLSLIHPEARSFLRFDSIREVLDRQDQIQRAEMVLRILLDTPYTEDYYGKPNV